MGAGRRGKVQARQMRHWGPAEGGDSIKRQRQAGGC